MTHIVLTILLVFILLLLLLPLLAYALRHIVTKTSLVSEGVLAFLRCKNIDIYGVHKNVKFLRHL